MSGAGVAIWLALAPTAVPKDSPSAAGVSVPEAGQRARRTRFAEAAVYDVVGGGSRADRWSGHVYGGWPWAGVRAQAGIGPRALSIGFDGETGRGRRFRAAVLVALRWVDRPRVRVTGETALGYVAQGGVLAQHGPNAEFRVRLAFPSGRIAPYAMLGTGHTLLADLRVVEASDGVSRDVSFRHVWTPRAAVGLAVALAGSVGLEFGIDLFWSDAPSRSPSLPGVHAGLAFGGGPR